ncbi:MAG: glycoside hydrolase family 3 protein [Christensenellales bacterium]|jgi:beta-glucosidase|nr:glycoside hydrolase family 3 protein [Clostridiales bacterium]
MNKRLIALLMAMLMLFPGVIAQEEEGTQAIVPVLYVPENGEQVKLGYTADTQILEVDGLKFKDLNKNGSLDVYEDWRKTVQERVDDLLSQMSATDKAAQMLHMTLVTLKESWFTELGVGFVLAYTYLSGGAEDAALKTNEVQALSEVSALGIPVIFSMDSVIGASWVQGATIIPDQLTLAATGNVDLVRQLNDMQRKEMLALGVRMSLSPIADIATDPRWGRVQECFGEDAELATQMTVAAIEGLQGGNKLTSESIMTCVKHFPGSGAQTAGVDGTPLVFDDQSFQMHLSVFKAAIEAGAASIMPYGYSTVPYLGGDAVENYAHESSKVMTELLREELGFNGIIQTDWGLNHTVAALAGADALGGAGQRESKKLTQNLTDEQFDERVGRLLKVKFELGLFENPYVDVENAKAVVGTEEHYKLAKQAAAEALTLVKYEDISPLAGQKLIVAGSLAEDTAALSSGWKIAEYEGKNILTAITEKAGTNNVTYIGDDVTQVASSYPSGTTAIVVVGEASGTHEPAWGTSTLEFPSMQTDMVKALKKAGVPVITVVLMNRAYVLTPIANNSDAVLLAYRPGCTAGAEAVAEAIFGEAKISGKTPFQIPATMDQVMLQREDFAKDIINPLYDYGYGIEVVSFGN